MGRLIFRGGVRVDFEDRTLTHLYNVILAKLRRGESLHFTWKDDISAGDGRTTIWIHPGTSFVCKFSGPPVEVNPLWLDELMTSAHSVSGLTITPEPPHPTPAGRD
ncbi:hypothetical protein JOD63_003061 [Microbacterium terrae]|uniref:DUF7882 domain-containing protein n=1 Tax=Microbacterium terrae TaxID=69369 RepID=A0A0M2HEM2_9MICO|nr:hypothetical protein [Microbacterium terrae]KJL42663.1 hypothetical protein RS81_01165 [Microbacterium terrae]MBP1079093.1 hypothetical protein [Microbacterium terrae]GLJ98493.1 hypothetical protein GCM10017594_16900 [Microbacterium terrae]